MTEHTEILEPGRPDRGTTRRRRSPVLIAVVAAVVLVLGGSAFAVYQLFAPSGPKAEEALPASTLAMVSIDLDPSAGQKIEAIKTLRKFPGLKDRLGLQADDDLRRLLVEKMIEANDCTGLDYDRDIEPWIGNRAAFAVVDLGAEESAPVIALQVTDKAAADAAFAKVVDCADFGADFGYTTTDDFLLASDSTEHARAIVDQARKGTLADDAAYQRWTGAVGEAGVLNFYVAESAKDALLGAMLGGFGMATGELGGQVPPISEDERRLLGERLDSFEGLAGTLRFADGGAEFAAVGADSYAGDGDVSGQVMSLPADTTAVLSFSVPDDLVATVLDQLRGVVGDQLDRGVQEFESETGLRLPDDVQTLLGDALSISLGGKAPESIMDVQDPSDVPVGVLIRGDEDRIEEVIDRLERSGGGALDDLGVTHEHADGKVVLASSQDYAKALLSQGELGTSENFKVAVPHTDGLAGVFYLDFDSDWGRAIARGYADDTGNQASDITDNLEPLRSLGVSAWTEDGVSHALLKITTD